VDTEPELHAVGATPPDFVLREPVSLGAFDITARIGMGGMGEVWRGVHRAQGLPVAVKVLTAFALRDDAALTAFGNEVRAVAGFDHPNIVTVFDYGEISKEAEERSYGKVIEGCPYLVMELASGGWLDATIVQLEWPHIQSLLTSLLDALAHAHARGVVHRDLKPENVLLPRRGGHWSNLKVTDFGISHATDWLDPHAATDPMSGAGTPHYMAPEQIYCRWRDQGPWTDLYAIGCLTWELVCGFPPFDYNNLDLVVDAQLKQQPPELSPRIEVPAGLEAWLNRLLAKNPQDRYRRAADALWALVRLAQPPAVRPTPPNEVPEPGATIHPSSPTARVRGPRAATITDLKPREVDVPADNALASGEGAANPNISQWLGHIPPFPPTWHAPEAELKTMQFIGAGIGLYGMRSIPLVDREAERNVLWSGLRNVRTSGSARLIALSGPSGVGKSRLAQWLCHRAHEVGSAITMRATYAPVPTPTTGLRHMLAHHFGCLGMPRTAIRQRLERVLTQQGVDDPYEWHAFTEILAEDRALDPDPAGRPIAFSSNAQRFAVIRRQLTRLSRERPVVVWLDAAHNSREALAFARYLLRFRTGLPVLLLLTVQDEAISERSEELELLDLVLQQSGTIDMRIPPLNEAATQELVRRLLMFEGELTHRIAERVAGNPAFAASLVADWVRRGVLELGREGFVVRPGAEDDLPDDLYAVWSRRLSRFLESIGDDAEARTALELAAALGRRFDIWEWHVACVEAGLGAGQSARVSELVRSLTDDLLADNLMREDETHQQLVFVHSMVRESLERHSRESGQWATVNRAVAGMLDKTYPMGAIAERLGRHLVAGETYEEALGPLLEGARRRWRRGSLAAALELLSVREDALLRAALGEEDPRWGDGWVLKAQVSGDRGDFEEAAGWASAADKQADRWPGEAWRRVRGAALLVMGTLAFRRGELARAKADLTLAWEVYDHLGTPLDQARCAMVLGEVQVASGEFDRGADLLTAALDLFREHGSPHDTALALRALGDLAWTVGNADDASRLFESARDLADANGDRLVVGQCMRGLAEVARSRGQFEVAETSFRESMELLRELEADWRPVRAKLALVKLQQGDFGQARELLEQGLKAAQARGRSVTMGRLAAMALATAAQSMNWTRYDELSQLAAEHLTASALVDPDVAFTTSLAGNLASSAGEEGRARLAYHIALEQWEALGKPERADRIRQLLMQLKQQPPR